ncbi:MAG: hypothetical protein K2W95_04345 [Candidatus Obscuribacterales bacterium]|nr:hypothetical protein [Candidatus Obscuribacterales bacterium]
MINSSFVGGLGGARKAAAFIHHLDRRGVAHRLVTDRQSLDKLELVGLTPDLVFDVSPDMSSSTVYREVRQSLRRVGYDCMISFGWRTYVPLNGIERSKPTIIIDGGWPEILAAMPSPFCKDVYRELTAYCLTSHFFDARLNKLLPEEPQIPFKWIAQPFGTEEISWLQSLADKRRMGNRDRFISTEPNTRTIFLDLNPEYIDPRQGTFTGGWLTPRQLDECRGFVSRLIVELDTANGPVALTMHERIAQQLSPIISGCKMLRVIGHPSLQPAEHHRLRAEADLVLMRATRCVGATQTAISLVPVLHTICPTAKDYMGEQYSCQIATDLGIANSIDHEAVSLRDGIMSYLNSPAAYDTARSAQEAALRAQMERGPDYLLSLAGLSSSAHSLKEVRSDSYRRESANMENLA